MKKNILFFIILLISPNFINAQWQIKNSGTDNFMTGIHYVTKNIVYMNGDHGLVYKSIDAGETWAELNTGYDEYLRAIYFTSEQTGWVVGLNGLILKTIDGGLNWVVQTSPSNEYLRSVFFITPNKGWIAGYNGTILSTVNGGSVWTIQTTPNTKNLKSIIFINENVGYATGYSGTILKTINGGNTWLAKNSGITSALNAISFATENIGWAVGSNGVIVKTINGGDLWNRINPNIDNHLSAISVLDQKNIICSGSIGTVISSNDGGDTWYKENTPTEEWLYGVDFQDLNNGLACGVNGIVLKYKSQDDITEGLIAYYPFNGNANDESGNNFNGVVFGAELTEDRFGVVNSAYFFNGYQDQISVNNVSNSLLEPEDEITVSCFIKASDISKTQRIVRKSAGGQTQDGYYLSWEEANQHGLEFFVDGMGSSKNFRLDVPNEPYVGQWIHIAGTFSEQTKTARLYINGEIVGSRTNNIYNLKHTDNVLYIGNFNKNEGFVGFIDDVRIYDRALSEAEIQILAAETFRREIIINKPNGNEKLLVGSTYNVKWYSNEVNYVNIDYSIDNGTTWIPVVNSTVSDGTYDWIIPNTPSNTCKMRISDSQNTVVSDESDIEFSIYGKSLILNSPKNFDEWEAGTTRIIEWTSIDIVNIKIEYTTDNGTSWQTIIPSTESDGYYDWLIPNTLSQQCKIKISDVQTPEIFDVNEEVFTIYETNLKLITPNGGEDWEVATNQNIVWQSNFIDNVKLEYSTDNGFNWLPIVNSTISDGLYSWAIPNSVSNLCLVRITDVLHSDIADISNGAFIISPSPNPVVVLARPNGGENWLVGETEKINWSSQDVNNIKLQYSVDNGANWTDIETNISASQNSYDWLVPNISSTNCLVKIEDITNSAVNDTSNSTFSIFVDQVITPIIVADSIWIDKRYEGVKIGLVDASASSINFGNIASYEWRLGGETLGTEPVATIELPSGTNELKLIVTSDMGIIDSISRNISVFAAKLKTQGPVLSSVSEFDSKTLFVSSMDNKIYEFDSTGVTNWTILTGGSIQSTICINDENSMYVGSTDARLYSFDNFGIPRWDKAMGGIVLSSPSVGPDGTMYIGLTTGRLFSMLEGGEINWVTQVQGAIISSPSISNNFVYFGSTDFNVYGASIDNGLLLYKYTTEDSVLSSPAIDKEGNVIIGANDGYLYKLDKELKLLWKYFSQGKIKSSPVIDAEGNIYFGSTNGNVYSVSKDKELIWKYNAGSPVVGNPTLAMDGSLHIGCKNGNMIVLSKKGELLWHLQTSGEILSSPLITNSNLSYVGSSDSSVYILKISNMTNYNSGLIMEWPTFKGNNQRTGYVWEGVVTNVDNTDDIIPMKFDLSQNYPNPFNPSTVINYSLIKNSKVNLSIYDVLGRKVLDLVNKEQAAGYYNISVNASELTSGIYFYRIQAGNYVETKKMILLK